MSLNLGNSSLGMGDDRGGATPAFPKTTRRIAWGGMDVPVTGCGRWGPRIPPPTSCWLWWRRGLLGRFADDADGRARYRWSREMLPQVNGALPCRRCTCEAARRATRPSSISTHQTQSCCRGSSTSSAQIPQTWSPDLPWMRRFATGFWWVCMKEGEIFFGWVGSETLITNCKELDD